MGIFLLATIEFLDLSLGGGGGGLSLFGLRISGVSNGGSECWGWRLVILGLFGVGLAECKGVLRERLIGMRG